MKSIKRKLLSKKNKNNLYNLKSLKKHNKKYSLRKHKHFKQIGGADTGLCPYKTGKSICKKTIASLSYYCDDHSCQVCGRKKDEGRSCTCFYPKFPINILNRDPDNIIKNIKSFDQSYHDKVTFKRTKPIDKSIKIIVFDFDQTLMKEHWHVVPKNYVHSTVEYTDFADGVKNLLKDLISNPMVEVVIASYGTLKFIRYALCKILKEKEVDEILIITGRNYNNYGQFLTNHKNQMLIDISLFFFGEHKFDNFMFFDDDPNNIEYAKTLFGLTNRSNVFLISRPNRGFTYTFGQVYKFLRDENIDINVNFKDYDEEKAITEIKKKGVGQFFIIYNPASNEYNLFVNTDNNKFKYFIIKSVPNNGRKLYLYTQNTQKKNFETIEKLIKYYTNNKKLPGIKQKLTKTTPIYDELQSSPADSSDDEESDGSDDDDNNPSDGDGEDEEEEAEDLPPSATPAAAAAVVAAAAAAAEAEGNKIVLIPLQKLIKKISNIKECAKKIKKALSA